NADVMDNLIKAMRDPAQIHEACDLAQELKLRTDSVLSGMERVRTRQGISTLQEFLRTGVRTRRTANGGSVEEQLTPDVRIQMHIAVTGDLGALRDQIVSRGVLSDVLQTAGRHKEAEVALLQAKKLSEQLPLDLIGAHGSLLASDAKNNKDPGVISW